MPLQIVCAISCGAPWLSMDGLVAPFIAINMDERFFFFTLASTFQLLDKPWSQVSSLRPPGSSNQFLSRIGFSNPTLGFSNPTLLVDFSTRVA